MYTQALLILILLDVQYLQTVAFSFKKGSKGQDHSSSDSHHPIKTSLPNKIFHQSSKGRGDYPHYHNAIWKTLLTNAHTHTLQSHGSPSPTRMDLEKCKKVAKEGSENISFDKGGTGGLCLFMFSWGGHRVFGTIFGGSCT